jgi:hypothetical protein
MIAGFVPAFGSLGISHCLVQVPLKADSETRIQVQVVCFKE